VQIVFHVSIVQSRGKRGNSLKGMAVSASTELTVAMSVATTDDFATVLRGWRTRRRLSQMDLAIEAGTTQRHVSFLERGRSMPGRDIVARLADSLQLTPRQRNALLSAAGFAPAHPESDPDAPVLEPVREALQHVLDGHLPYPAMVMNGFGELVAVNDAFGLLVEGVAPRLLEPPVNVLRVALHPEGMAPRTANLDDWRRHILHGLRQRGPHPRIDALIDELEAYGLPAPGSEPIESLGFAVPLHLRTDDGDVRLVATISTFVTALDVTVSELRLEAFLPADRETAEMLARRGKARGTSVVSPK
jgi:transcriptional regulator with XRE-family HTH domain